MKKILPVLVALCGVFVCGGGFGLATGHPGIQGLMLVGGTAWSMLTVWDIMALVKVKNAA